MRHVRAIVAVFVMFFAFIAVPAGAGPIVYLGLDPGNGHFSDPDAEQLIFNAATYAGGNSNPILGVLDPSESGGFGSGLTTKLSNVGLTNVTFLSSAFFAGATVGDLSGFDALYFGPTNAQTTVDNLNLAAAAILSYVSASGGLVVETNTRALGSWDWVPGAGLIGHSGATNLLGSTVNIVDPSHPVMSGLSSAGLSNWGASVHSNFATPGAAGLQVLAVDADGFAVIAVTPVPEPNAAVLFGVGSLIVGLTVRKKANA